MTDTVVFAWLAGVGAGWIASWWFVVRPERDTVRDMRYEGFVRDKPIPPRSHRVKPLLERNET